MLWHTCAPSPLSTVLDLLAVRREASSIYSWRGQQFKDLVNLCQTFGLVCPGTIVLGLIVSSDGANDFVGWVRQCCQETV